MEKGIKDEYLEHNAYHQSYHADCSSCYSENRLLKAKVTVDRNWGTPLSKANPRNPYGDNYPLGYIPD